MERHTLSIGYEITDNKVYYKRPRSWKMHIKETHLGPLCARNKAFMERQTLSIATDLDNKVHHKHPTLL